MCHPLFLAGDWEQAVANAGEILEETSLEAGTIVATNLLAPLTHIRVNQGAVADAEALLRARLKARLAARRDEGDEAETGFRAAAALFRELGMPFWLAVSLLEQAEWLAVEDRAAEAEPLLAEAREIFERLEATPWLERIALASNEHANV